MPSGLPGSEEPAEDHRSEEHTSELQSLRHLVCRLLLEKKNSLFLLATARSMPRARSARRDRWNALKALPGQSSPKTTPAAPSSPRTPPRAWHSKPDTRH